MPYLVLWYFLILIARKQNCEGLRIVDVSSTQSQLGSLFQEDVRHVLGQMTDNLDENLPVLKRHVRTIARGDVVNAVEYYSVARLLILRVDYGSPELDSRGVVLDAFQWFAETFRE